MIQIIDISLIPSDNKPVINVSQFDNISRVLRFNVFDDAEMSTPHVFDNTETVLLNIRKNDNNIVVITGVIVSDIDPETQEITEQYLTFELTEQACACVGSNYGEVAITDGSAEVIGSCNFKLIVERSPLAGGVSSQTAIDNLTTQIEQITEEVIGENYYTKTETDDLLDDKADITDLPDMSDYYTKTETDNLLSDKADADAVYTKTETDDLLDDKADITDLPDMSDYYTKTETDNLLSDKADADAVYTKTETDNLIYALLPVGTASGSIASFNTALANPLVSCDVDENATTLTKCSTNINNEVFEPGYLSSSGGETYTLNSIRNKNYQKCFAGQKFYGLNGVGSTVYCCFYDSTKIFLSRSLIQNSVVTVPANAAYYRYSVYQYGSEVYDPNTKPLGSNYPETEMAYYSYNGVNYNLPLSEMPITNNGINNFFADVGDISLSYKDTIQNYIDTRVNTVSNRSLSMMRTLETLEKSVTLDKSSELERGDNNDDNAR